MIDETNSNYGTLLEAEPFVSVPASQYERYLRLSMLAECMAETISDDWIKAAERGYDGISDALKVMLRLYNVELYRKTEKAAKEAEEKHQKELSEKLDREFQKQSPAVYPYIPQDPPGFPYQGVEITCEYKSGDHE